MRYVGKRALAHMMHRGLHQSFEVWRANAKRRQRARELSFRIMQRLFIRQLGVGWSSWKRWIHLHHLRRERRLFSRVRKNLLYRLKMRAFRGWSHMVQVHKRLKGIGRSVILRMTQQNLVRCYGQWRRATNHRVRARVALHRIVGRLLRLKLVRAWITWRQVHSQSHERSMQLLRRVRANLCYRSLARTFRRWLYYSKSQKHSHYVLNKALRRFKYTSLTRAFRSWLLFGRRRVYLRRLILSAHKKKMLISVKLAWDIWRRIVLRTSRLNIVRKLTLRHITHKTLFLALNKWKDFWLHRYQEKMEYERACDSLYRLCMPSNKKRLRKSWRLWQNNAITIPAKTDSKQLRMIVLRNRATAVARVTRRHVKKWLGVAFTQWKKAGEYFREVTVKAHSLMLRWYKGIVGPAFAKWQWYGQQLSQMWRGLNYFERCYTHQSKKNIRIAWQRWVNFAIILPRMRECQMLRSTLHSVRASMISRLTTQYLMRHKHDVVIAWKDKTLRLREATNISKRVMSRWYCAQIRPAYIKWKFWSKHLAKSCLVLCKLLHQYDLHFKKIAFVEWEKTIVRQKQQAGAAQHICKILKVWRKNQLSRGFNSFRFVVTWRKQNLYNLIALFQKRRLNGVLIRRCFGIWESKILQRKRARHIISGMMKHLYRASLSRAFSEWMAFRRKQQEKHGEEKVRMFKALAKWQSLVGLVVIDERYNCQVEILQHKINAMLNNLRTIRIPEHLKNSNRMREKTLSELRQILAELQNLELRQHSLNVNGQELRNITDSILIPSIQDEKESNYEFVDDISSIQETEEEMDKLELKNFELDQNLNLNISRTSQSDDSSIRSAIFERVSSSYYQDYAESSLRGTASLMNSTYNAMKSSTNSATKWRTRFGHGTSLTSPDRVSSKYARNMVGFTTPKKRYSSPRPLPGGGGSGHGRSRSRLPPPSQRYDTYERMIQETQKYE